MATNLNKASPLLQLQQLSIAPKKMPTRLLVNNVSLTIEVGKTTCVVGESGSGKSLTALSIMGLLSQQLQLTAGKVLFNDGQSGEQDLTKLDEANLRKIRGAKIAMIFQEPMTSLNPVLTIGYQIGESLTTHLGVKGDQLKAKIASLLEMVGIPAGRANNYPDELSGGQRQRVMIAMSIACEPRLLIADEPTTALDVTVQAQILKLLDELKTRMNMGMLFITHDFGVVADIADYVAVMFRGEIVESGTKMQVLNKPQHPYTQALLACVPDAEGKKPLKPIDYAWLPENQQILQTSAQKFKDCRMTTPILQANNLVKTYTQRSGKFGFGTSLVKALDDVSISLTEGKTLAVVGESGSGKSTLARCLLQLQPLDSGEVLFAGQDLAKLDGAALRVVRKNLQMVFQDPFASLNPRMRVGEIVGEGLLIHGLGSGAEQQRKVIAMLNRVGLTEADMQKYPHEFSGGQRQRVGIARALVLQPKVVVCDEPVSALDVSIQAQILLLLKELQAEMALSYLFISHDLRVVRHIADDIVVMHQGKIVEYGAVVDIYQQPQHEYTRNLLAAMPGKYMALVGN